MPVRPITSLRAGATYRAGIAVIGAGPAGITITRAMRSRGLDVALLEAGGTAFSEVSQRRYAGEVEATAPGAAYPPLDAWRLRQFGGTSNHWGGWCRPLERNVLESRPWISDAAWPAGFDADSPHVAAAHELCELGPFQYDPDTIERQLGVEPDPAWASDDVERVAWRFSPPTRFAERYGRDLDVSAGDTFLGANVVDFHVDGSAVRGVTVVGDDGEARSVEAEHVVLACGGIESVRHLLVLAERHDVALDRSGWLGRGFMEHPHAVVGAVVVAPPMSAHDPLELMRAEFLGGDGHRVRLGVALTPAACLNRSLPNMSITLEPLTDERFAAIPRGRAMRELVDLASGRPSEVMALYVRAEQRPVLSSALTLTGGRDDLGMPRLRLSWSVDRRDLDGYAIGVELLAKQLIGRRIGVVHNAGLVGDIDGLTGGAHHLGGARTHESPDHGVVDLDGRAHAVPNLWVCSGAVFPTCGFSNPTLTIVAMGLRMADRIASA